jgi:hypothetical protein
VGIVAASTIALGLASLSSAAWGAIIEQRDSADFNIKNLEGDSVPGSAAFGDISDWSVDGQGNYRVEQDNKDGAVGVSGQFDYLDGWTGEIRFQITEAPSAAPYVLQFTLSANTGSETGQTYVLNIHDTGIVNANNLSTPLYSGSLSDGFHTLRLAKEADAGSPEMKVWLDGTEIASDITSSSTSTTNRQWLGDLGGSVQDGTALVDYVRFDNTGAYAPIPEPSALLLASIGILGLALRRRASR